MSGLTLLAGAAGVRGLIIGTARGDLVCEVGASKGAAAAAAAAAVLGSQLDRVGEVLRLGSFAVAVLKASRETRLLGQQRTAVALLQMEGNRPTGEAEALLRDTDWTSDLAAGIAELETAVELDVEADSERLGTGEVRASSRGARTGDDAVVAQTMVSAAPTSGPSPKTATAGGADPSWNIGYVLRGWLGSTRPAGDNPSTAPRAPLPSSPGSGRSAAPAPPAPAAAARPPSSPGAREIPPPSSRGEWGESEKTPTTSRRITPNGTVLSGSLSLFSLPDLLEIFRSGHRTGTLVCASEQGLGALHLKAGRITGAYSPNVPSLGDWLVRRGMITEAALRQALSLQKEGDDGGLLGATLVERGLVNPEVVRTALRSLISETVRDLMGWANGQFTFDPEAVVEAAPPEIVVELDPQGLLLDIFRELDEAGR
jgi:hypothetical protein